MIIYKNGWTVNKFQRQYLFATCNLTCFTSLLASYMKVGLVKSLPIYSIWFTSILYWWDPVEGWRRDLDVWVSHSCIGFYTLCLGYYRPRNWLPCALGIGLSSLLFRTLSMYYYNKLALLHDNTCSLESEGIYNCPFKNDYSWKSVLYHSGIHIFTNLICGVSLYYYGSSIEN